MHGVGYRFVKDAFQAFGLLEPVPTDQQVQPDPNFPTASFPNPEEKGTLDLAMQKAEKEGIKLVIATDPDADRCSFVEYNDKEKRWQRFTGDEIGAILANRQFQDWREANPTADPKTVAMVNSAVSSRFIDVMGRKEGFQTAQTLTGFKWIGNKMLDYNATGACHAIFGYEEAIGYCLDSAIVVDKDGISASAVVGELMALVYAQGKTMKQHLDEIYAKYGIAVSNNSYLLCYDPPTITRIFNKIRVSGAGKPENATCGDTYPRRFVHPKTGSVFEVKDVRDLHTGYDSSTPDKKATLPTSTDSEMLTLTFTNGAAITIRTSGTEPKVKYYSELTGTDHARVTKELGELVETVIETCLEPSVNGLLPPVAQ
jgi:phosphomannomutase